VAGYRAGVEAPLKQAETERGEALVREAEQRKRRRTVQVAGGVIAVVLLAGLSVSLWQMFRAIDAEGQHRLHHLPTRRPLRFQDTGQGFFRRTPGLVDPPREVEADTKVGCSGQMDFQRVQQVQFRIKSRG
jgi:hypothetical protein